MDLYRHFYYNRSWQILETRKSASENTEPETLAVEMQYVWSARYIDAPILRDRDADGDSQTGNLGKTGSGLEERLYYLTDANMNVTTLVDTGGDAVERYVYDPYGKVTVLDADWSADTDGKSDYANNILFCGYYRDNETGLYSVRRRYLHIYLGWLSRDPLDYADGMDLYEYVGSNPLVRIDPTGMFWDTAQQAMGKAKRAIEKVEKVVEEVGRAIEAVSEKIAQAEEAVQEAEDTAEEVAEKAKAAAKAAAQAAYNEFQCQHGFDRLLFCKALEMRYEALAAANQALADLDETIAMGASGQPELTPIGVVAELGARVHGPIAEEYRDFAATARRGQKKACMEYIIPHCCKDVAERYCGEYMQ